MLDLFIYPTPTMIDAKEALRAILSKTPTYKFHTVSLENALGHYLAEDVFADRDQPPFDRVMMDGIAARRKDLSQEKPLKILGVLSAGSPQETLPEGEVCYEIMTGAMLPEKADIVVRYEDLLLENGNAILKVHPSTLIGNFHHKGSDYKAGSKVLSSGTLIRSTHTAILASVGRIEVKVFKLPSVAILSTGDELVEIGEEPLPHQIRWSNGIGLKQELRAVGLSEVTIEKVSDDELKIRHTLQGLLASHDVLLLTGGVSAGKFDFVPKLLKECEVREVFHKVAQRPGKPLWFGRTADGKAVFGLPGNPVSCLVNLRKFVVPFLFGGLRPQIPELAVLADDVPFSGALTYYCPVKVKNENGMRLAVPLFGNGSGDFFHLRDSDGFIELSPSQAPFKKGLVAEIFLWGDQ